jgi:small subunit ribosomal protein S16
MLVIRLSRKGKTKQPFYRLILCEKQKDPWGRYLENLGTYNPFTKEMVFNLDRIKYWLSKGAQPSDTVWNMLVTKGLVEGKKRTITKISKIRAEKIKKKKETEEKAEVPAAASVAAEVPTPAEEAPALKPEKATEKPAAQASASDASAATDKEESKV